jgi:hypothetical protein
MHHKYDRYSRRCGKKIVSLRRNFLNLTVWDLYLNETLVYQAFCLDPWDGASRLFHRDYPDDITKQSFKTISVPASLEEWTEGDLSENLQERLRSEAQTNCRPLQWKSAKPKSIHLNNRLPN